MVQRSDKVAICSERFLNAEWVLEAVKQALNVVCYDQRCVFCTGEKITYSFIRDLSGDQHTGKKKNTYDELRSVHATPSITRENYSGYATNR